MNKGIKGLLVGVSATVVLASCTHPKEPFQKVVNRPQEICNVATYGGEYSEEEVLAEQNVMRYVVQKGDTLWSISKRFLAQPWHWKTIWYNNPHIRNPHRIYPGDVLAVVYVEGRARLTIVEDGSGYHGEKTGKFTKEGAEIYKYRPGVREYQYANEPILFTNNMIAPMVLKVDVRSEAEIRALPFIFGDAGDYLSLTFAHQDVFAKNLPEGVDEFVAYRAGERLGGGHRVLHYTGTVRVLERAPDGLARLEIVGHGREIMEGDVLLPLEASEPSDYFPALPMSDCTQGFMLANVNDMTLSVKEFDTVVTSFGRDNNAQVGDVWKIVRRQESRVVNNEHVVLPEKELGYLMIVKVYGDYSLGLVLDSQQEISINDVLVRP